MIYKSRLIDITLIIISLYSLFFIFHKFLGGKIPFWDFHIIYCASKTFFLGNFPYGLDAHGDCLDPNIKLTANFLPSTYEMLKYFGSLNISTAKFLWIFLETISIALIFFISKELFKINFNWRNFLLIIFSFGSTIFISFFSGNISVILYGFLILGIYFLNKNFNNIFYIIVIFVSLFKFYYLTFLILPFYILGWNSIKNIFFYLFLFFLIQYFFYINNTDLTIAFFDIIQGKVEGNLPTRFLTGTGLYSIIEKMPWAFFGVKNFDKSYFSLEISLFLWLLISSIFLLSIFLCLNSERIKNSKNHSLYCISFGVLIINLIIPRLVVYDLVLTVPIIFYLLNKINFKELEIYKLRLFFIFLFLIIFDHHFSFFIIISFLTLFIYSEFYKKNLFVY
tara:strand:- start:505 stop:1686 length:1182 start_codon:yes stop_codon:yes gene_type:complete